MWDTINVLPKYLKSYGVNKTKTIMMNQANVSQGHHHLKHYILLLYIGLIF